MFFRLNTLKAGDDVFVKRADGTTAEFRVTEIQTYLKDHFPTQTVYGPTPDAELRLITCGGAFDPVSPPLPEQYRRVRHPGPLTRGPGEDGT